MGVIVIGQSKGGVGKTTIAVNLAGDIVRHGRSATVIDADPQESAVQWAQPQRLGFPVRAELLVPGGELIWARNVLKTRGDFTIIDLPAGLDQAFETAVLISDLLIVPCGPSSIDLSAAQRTLVRAREVRRLEPVATPFRMATVATRVQPDTDEGAQIDEALGELGEPVAPSLSYDMGHPRSFADGVTAPDMSSDGKPVEEIRRLTLFVLRQLAPRQTFRVG